MSSNTPPSGAQPRSNVRIHTNPTTPATVASHPANASPTPVSPKPTTPISPVLTTRTHTLDGVISGIRTTPTQNQAQLAQMIANRRAAEEQPTIYEDLNDGDHLPTAVITPAPEPVAAAPTHAASSSNLAPPPQLISATPSLSLVWESNPIGIGADHSRAASAIEGVPQQQISEIQPASKTSPVLIHTALANATASSSSSLSPPIAAHPAPKLPSASPGSLPNSNGDASPKQVVVVDMPVKTRGASNGAPMPLSQASYIKGPPSPIESANFFSILTVWWASALIVLGNKRPLDDSDVPEMPSKDTVAVVFQKFQKFFQRSRANGRPGSVTGAIFKAFGWWWIKGGMMLVVATGFQIVQPLFVQKLVEVLRDPNETNSTGYLWSAALIGTTLLSSLFLNQHFFNLIRAGNAARVACVASIYDKSLKLSRASRQIHSTGATVNIMSNDTQRLFDCALILHFIWIAPTTIIVALALMIVEVGVAAVAGVVLFCLLSPFQVYISRLTGRNRREMLQYSDQRVKLMAEILQGIRVVKLYAWEQAIAGKIEAIRQEELKRVRMGLYLNALNQTILFVMPAAVAAVIMCVYAALGNEVNVSNTFTILAYLNIIRNPTVLIPMTINALAEARVSMNRIYQFLTLEELPPRKRLPYDSSIPYAISVRNGMFMWAPDQSVPTLRDISLQIKTGSLVAIIGSVGVGKCWGAGTKLMLYDGRTMKVESIVSAMNRGETIELMGDDGTVRKTIPGTATIGNTKYDANRSHESNAATYRITSENNGRDSWTCNGDHILVLKFNVRPTKVAEWSELEHGRSKPFFYSVVTEMDGIAVEKTFYFDTKEGAEAARESADAEWEPFIWEGSVNQFNKMSEYVQSAAQMYQPDSIQFQQTGKSLKQRLKEALMYVHTEMYDYEAESTLTPYNVELTGWVIGVCLTYDTRLSTVVRQIQMDGANAAHSHPDLVAKLCEWHNIVMRVNQPVMIDTVSLCPVLHHLMQSYKIDCQKNFPHDLLTESKDVRMSLLAGVIGGNRFVTPDRMYEVSVTQPRFLDGIIHLARGLGFSTSKVCETRHTDELSSGFYIHIGGDDLPILKTILPFEQIAPSTCSHLDQRCHRFKIEKIAHADYYGFEIDGNGRCLMGDFVVTHNSSLIAALLGEMLQVNPVDPKLPVPEDDQVLINGTLAYVSQEAWIRNDTVKGNILFGLPFVALKYQQCLEAACLTRDLASLPNGDQTEIGERGINLSGGQKSRVSVARALYRHELCDIFLLDDPFAAVDMAVGSHIFHHALQRLLHAKTRVVVLSSHLHLLEHFDQIIVIEKQQNGQIQAKLESPPPGNSSCAPPPPSKGMITVTSVVPPSSVKVGTGAAMPKTTESGCVAAIGTFGELKTRYYALMSQRNEEDEDDDDVPDLDDVQPVSPLDDNIPFTLELEPGQAATSTIVVDAIEEAKDGTGMDQLQRHRTISGSNAPASTKSRTRKLTRRTSSREESVHSRASSKGHVIPPPPKAALIEKEDRAQGAVGIATWVAYFAGGSSQWQGALVLAFVVFLFVLSQAARVGCDTWLSIWSARSRWLDKETNWWIAIYFFIVALTLILAVARSFTFAHNVALRSSRRIHDIAFRLLMRASIPQFFDVTPIGRVLNRFSSDLDRLDTLLPTTFFQFAQNVFTLVGVVAICITGSYYMAALFVPIAALFYSVQRYFRNSQRELKRIENTTRSPIFSLFSETLQGLTVIRAYGVEEEFRARNRTIVEQNSKVYSILWWSQRWIALRLDWVSMLVIVAICFLVVGLRDTITVGVASLALVYSLQFTGLLQITVRNSVDAENYLTSVERLMAFQQIPTEAAAIIEERMPPKDWPQHGGIRFDSLELRYRPDLPLVLKGITCEIRPQEKIGICGRTGSGKSSLMVALFRLVEPHSGRIFIDGVDISTIGLETLRSNLSIIPQDPVMFSSTIRYNLDPFGYCTDDEVVQVLERVHLVDMLRSMPLGLQAPVSENGENLSQGQRQLICIARALLRKSKIIILDEATSSVDAETDALIQETIRTNFSHATVLTIAHRLETIVDADRIMLLSDGRVAEFDSPHRLLSDASHFRNLVAEGGEANLTRLQALARDADMARKNLVRRNSTKVRRADENGNRASPSK